MIDANQKQQLLSLMQSPQWNVIDQIANGLCDRIAYNEVAADTQWDLVKTKLTDDGKIAGIRQLLKTLEEYART